MTLTGQTSYALREFTCRCRGGSTVNDLDRQNQLRSTAIGGTLCMGVQRMTLTDKTSYTLRHFTCRCGWEYSEWPWQTKPATLCANSRVGVEGGTANGLDRPNQLRCALTHVSVPWPWQAKPSTVPAVDDVGVWQLVSGDRMVAVQIPLAHVMAMERRKLVWVTTSLQIKHGLSTDVLSWYFLKEAL
jgi:hypothetical protein